MQFIPQHLTTWLTQRYTDIIRRSKHTLRYMRLTSLVVRLCCCWTGCGAQWLLPKTQREKSPNELDIHSICHSCFNKKKNSLKEDSKYWWLHYIKIYFKGHQCGKFASLWQEGKQFFGIIKNEERYMQPVAIHKTFNTYFFFFCLIFSCCCF